MSGLGENLVTVETMAAEVEASYTIPPAPLLSPNQLTTIALAAAGLTNAEIAEQLHLTEDTIKSRFKRIRHLLGTRNTVHTVAYCMRRGLLPEDAK